MNSPYRTAQKKIEEGLHLEALNILEPWILETRDPKEETELDMAKGVSEVVNCLEKLNRLAEVDAFLEKVAETHPAGWRILGAVSEIYQRFASGNSFGFLIDGKFVRTRGYSLRGKRIFSSDRDRVRALQLKVQAMPLLRKENIAKDSPKIDQVDDFYLSFAEALNDGRFPWKLQALTDLATLPDYEEEYYHEHSIGAPVDAQGNPVLYSVPESFETARNDGERWRWVLEQVNHRLIPLKKRYEFSKSQFGEQTLSSPSFRDQSEEQAQRFAEIWSLETLKDDEVIARLATGMKRFKLSDEFHYIALLKERIEQVDSYEKAGIVEELAGIALDRMQFEKAAGYLREAISLLKKAEAEGKIEEVRKKLNQIEGNWGEFEVTSSEVVGTNAKLGYQFRNGKKVKLTAKEIRIPLLLEEIKSYLRSKPDRLDWSRVRIEQIGSELVYHHEENDEAKKVREKYLGREVAAWSVDLDPAPKHFNRRATIDVPLDKAGAYLISAEMEGGNTEYLILWLEDTILVQKNLDGASLYFLADALTGEPVPSATLDFFGYKVEWPSMPAPGGRQRRSTAPEWSFQQAGETSDPNGLAIMNKKKLPDGFNWLVTAKDPKGRFAFLGFNGIWIQKRELDRYDQTKVFFISDRPVYRPKDKVEMKCWVGSVRYDQPNESRWAGKTVGYEIIDPRGEKVVERSEIKLDEYGGLVAQWELPADAMLGTYRFQLTGSGKQSESGRPQWDFPWQGGEFRVEEYKKPEYSVSVEAPKDPVTLGETIKATVRADYYFGSPVTEATVRYKVLRQKKNEPWYPVRPWDWFYGPGYGWLAYDSDWLPGWGRWGTCRPLPPWFTRPSGPPELVASQEVAIGPDGTVVIELDTSEAKKLFPDDDQRYTITAEVVDRSRRTIVGTGTVLVAKEPFKVYAWTDRGWYEPDAKVRASFQARRLDGKPVGGDAEVRLFKLTYRDREDGVDVEEKEVHRAPVRFDEEGHASISLAAAESGQYRISCLLNDQEGGYLFNVYPRESASDAASWKFNGLELIPDRAEYAPGETLRLQINSDRENAFVLLFPKASDGLCGGPQIVRLDGKSRNVPITVEKTDMPNFFVEALTVRKGETISEIRELAVPPEKRILNVEVLPSRETYKPGEKSQAELRVTDLDGKPVVGQTVVSIYDKSVEAVSGGSNVPDIKEFFWKWKRYHHLNVSTSFNQFYCNVNDRWGRPVMERLGLFGHLTSQRDRDAVHVNGQLPLNRMMKSMGGMREEDGMVMMEAAPMAAMAPMPENNSGESARMDMGHEDAGGAGGHAEPTIRENFADTALWVGALETNAEGIAKIELEMPESLTTWKINVWAMSAGTRVGYGPAEVITRKDLILRMQTPRFLVEKDRALLTANVHNYLSSEKEVRVVLETDPFLELSEGENRTKTVVIPAGGEARIDWSVRAKTAGEAGVTMKALADEESDAMRRTLPVAEHGMLRQQAWSGYLSPETEIEKIEIDVPEARKPESTRLTIRFSPSLAASMIESLPYLVDYPYGCTEQTLNRFLPTVIVQKILLDSGVDLESLAESRTNLNAQELGEARKPALARKVEPVYDIKQVRDMVSDGVAKLAAMQCDDGGWGWFGGWRERSSPHLTALIVHGLHLARQNDVTMDENLLKRGRDWLERYRKNQIRLLETALLPEEERRKKQWKSRADETDAFVEMVLSERDDVRNPDEMSVRMRDFLWRDRGKLTPYGIALLGIALHERPGANDKERIDGCVRLLDQYLVRDAENQTAYLNLDRDGGWAWWSWQGSEFETQAYFLKLLVRTDPKSPDAPRMVKYLLNNRRHATYWNSTRDTAVCVEAFAEYLRATDETAPEMTLEIFFDDDMDKVLPITAENMFRIDNSHVLVADEVSAGRHWVEFRKTGKGPLYYNVYLENHTLEDPIEKAGLEVKIERKLYRLDRDESASAQARGARGQVLDLKTVKYKRTELAGDKATLKSGELVEIELIVESKNDYESILIEDMKAAGLEPVELLSGYVGNELGAYVEYRDDRVAMFVYRLPRGRHSVTYRLRAEQPGDYGALPARISGMYAPELKGNSDENKISVTDR